MKIQYPDEFIQAAKTQKILFIDPPQAYLYDCPNCSGLGLLFAFFVSKGPFKNPPPLERGEVLKSVYDNSYGWLWYKGKSRSLPCKICDGLGGDISKNKQEPITPKEYREKYPDEIIDDLADKKSVEKTGIYRDHTI
jgi:hypothetical protein